MTESAFADEVRALLAAVAGVEPPDDVIETLGGWDRVAAHVSELVADPVLVPVVRLVCRYAYAAPAEAIIAAVDAVFSESSATGFSECLAVLVETPEVVAVEGSRIHDLALDIVESTRRDHPHDPGPALRAAEALEAATRLALGDYAREHALLAQLSKFDAPVDARLGAAVIRCASAAVDSWPHAQHLDENVRLVGGIDGAHAGDTGPMQSDAAWALTTIAWVGALRADTPEDMRDQLAAAQTFAEVAAEAYERDDAAALVPVLTAVQALLAGDGPSVAALSSPALSDTAVDAAVRAAAEFAMTSAGLGHWASDAKVASLQAWALLLADLRAAGDSFDRDSFYDPATVVGDLLDLYTLSRSVQVVRRLSDRNAVLELVQPVVETGFASKAAFVAHLADHVADLDRRVADGEDAELQALRDVAETVLTAARAVVEHTEPPGKVSGGGGPVQLPPPLDRIFANSAHAAEVAVLSPEALELLAESVDRIPATRRTSMVETAVQTRIVNDLGESPDFTGPVAAAVDTMLLLLIRFVGDRSNAQPGRKPYLFDPEAKESDLQEDLYDFLVGSDQIGSTAELEVQNLGHGRVDIRIPFNGFALVLELKLDGTRARMSDRTAYIKQAATYQATDVRIGFVVALRTAAFDPTGPTPHLSTLFEHTTFEVEGEDTPRHIVLVQVPGNQTRPSDMPAS
ncbi:hypothetical protein [Aeromicrobium erythreum]|uniref:Uncharacterized protein n=1 Tax=Aeromicrobium erythreum TaxID=2041 RepID=A0A0U4CDB2_9ACTN|nr:hypothetical protein [Aeromicrobium erythreum]ALX03445.1 hypothetical protein AERYTH_01385 [Aeromicrobium erythreum]